MKEEMAITPGCFYRVKGSDAQVIVTGIGLDNILFAPLPLVKLNGAYVEHCKTRSQFKRDFLPCEDMETEE